MKFAFDGALGVSVSELAELQPNVVFERQDPSLGVRSTLQSILGHALDATQRFDRVSGIYGGYIARYSDSTKMTKRVDELLSLEPPARNYQSADSRQRAK